MESPLPTNLNDEWRNFLAKTADIDRGFTCYDIGFEEPVLFPLQRKNEMSEMMMLAQEINPRVVCELGSDKGFSFWSWIKCHPAVTKAISIEIRGVPYIELFQDAFPDVKMLGIADSSYAPATVQKVRDFLGEDKIDCLFIDSDKCAYDKDFKAYLPLMRKGGIVFMHDCNPKCNPRDFPCVVFFQSLIGKYKTELILDESEHAVAVAKEGKHFENSYEGWLHYWASIPTCGVGVCRL